MTEVNDNKLPIWFWICTIILVLWALMGMFVYYDFVTTTSEKMAKYIADGVYSQGYADSPCGRACLVNRRICLGCMYKCARRARFGVA